MEWPKILTRRRQLLLSLVGGRGMGQTTSYTWKLCLGGGGEGGIPAQRGYILNLGVSISVSS